MKEKKKPGRKSKFKNTETVKKNVLLPESHLSECLDKIAEIVKPFLYVNKNDNK